MKSARAEKKRLERLLRFETKAYEAGYQIVAGVDEVGRGPLAGPVVACACILPPNVTFPKINDSKLLSAEDREDLYHKITGHQGVHYAIGIVDHFLIDAINILQASLYAMKRAISALTPQPDFLLIDGNRLPECNIARQCIVKGDALSMSIAAASILAKVTRDRMMLEFHQKWPQYSFDKHKGYATEVHLKALKENGPSPIHRKTFGSVKPCIEDLSEFKQDVIA